MRQPTRIRERLRASRRGYPPQCWPSDHVGHLVEPVAGSAPDELGELLTFSDVRDMDPGHDP